MQMALTFSKPYERRTDGHETARRAASVRLHAPSQRCLPRETLTHLGSFLTAEDAGEGGEREGGLRTLVWRGMMEGVGLFWGGGGFRRRVGWGEGEVRRREWKREEREKEEERKTE